MRIPVLFTTFLAVALFAAAARAHFVWITVVGDGPDAKVEVYFSESADAGEPQLVEKIANAKVLVRAGKNRNPQPIELKPVHDELTGKLVGSAPDAKSYCLDAICDYGVVERGGQTFLLQYYANHIHGSAKSVQPANGGLSLAPLADQLDATAAGLSCTVLWKGKPLADSEIVVQFPEGDVLERTTNERGQVEIATKTKGPFAIRARHVEAGKSGERDGKKYGEIRHYATLTAALPADATRAAANSVSAAELLRSAREARAVWNNFPGFTADLAVRYNDEHAKGKVTITGDGEVILKMPEFGGSEWLQTYLESVVQHRMPGDPASENVRYPGEPDGHPLGRKIALGDGEQDSVYRIGKDVVREVNRRAGPGRFTISVLEVERNPEGKYLPVYYTMTFWNATEKVTSTSTTHDAWARVGDFDLPRRTLQVTATDDGRDVKLLEFSNHELVGQ
jgi:hypothetical protein